MNSPIISLPALKDEADRLTAEIEHKKKLREALWTVIELYRGNGDAEAAPSTGQAEFLPQPGTNRLAESPKPLEHRTTDLSDLSVNFTGTTNLLERLVRIGQSAEERILNLTEVSKFLLKNGESVASLRNLRNNVYSCLKDHPEHFEKVGSGNYLYRDTTRKNDLGDCSNNRAAPQSLPIRDLL